MPHKSSNDKSAYKSKTNSELGKLKNGEIQAARIVLTIINIRQIANT